MPWQYQAEKRRIRSEIVQRVRNKFYGICSISHVWPFHTFSNRVQVFLSSAYLVQYRSKIMGHIYSLWYKRNMNIRVSSTFVVYIRQRYVVTVSKLCVVFGGMACFPSSNQVLLFVYTIILMEWLPLTVNSNIGTNVNKKMIGTYGVPKLWIYDAFEAMVECFHWRKLKLQFSAVILRAIAHKR